MHDILLPILIDAYDRFRSHLPGLAGFTAIFFDILAVIKADNLRVNLMASQRLRYGSRTSAALKSSLERMIILRRHDTSVNDRPERRTYDFTNDGASMCGVRSKGRLQQGNG